MATVIEVPDLRDGYVDVVNRVLLDGEVVAPRGEKTRELLDVTIVLTDPTDALPVGVGRRLNPAVGFAEAIQLIGGFSAPGLLPAGFDRYREDDGTFWGAYGRRSHGQLHQVVRKLRDDPDSRRALVTLWNPLLDNEDGHRDYPCTVVLQFLIRDGRLSLHTTMRSNDVWLGLAYDAFQFTQLQLTIARVLGVDVGPYVHHAVSLHIYDRDVGAATQLRYAVDGSPSLQPCGIGRTDDSLVTVQRRALALARGETPTGITFSEAEYLRRLP